MARGAIESSDASRAGPGNSLGSTRIEHCGLLYGRGEGPCGTHVRVVKVGIHGIAVGIVDARAQGRRFHVQDHANDIESLGVIAHVVSNSNGDADVASFIGDLKVG